MAVSDVLYEAIKQIEDHMVPPSIYDGEARKKIAHLLGQMDEVRFYLDTPPGTERESAAENVT
jgi:hypothetical protein